MICEFFLINSILQDDKHIKEKNGKLFASLSD